MQFIPRADVGDRPAPCAVKFPLAIGSRQTAGFAATISLANLRLNFQNNLRTMFQGAGLE